MLRAINALAGVLLFTTGIIVTVSTLTVDGWTVLAGVGAVMVAIDLGVEQYQWSDS